MTSDALDRIGDPATAVVDFPLLVRIRDGDHDALKELYDTFGLLIYGKARRITNEGLAAELITAGVFAKVWRCPHEFPVDGLEHSLIELAERRSLKWIYES